MTTRTVPFHYGFFFHAMIALIGREPDDSHRLGWDGIYTFRYAPKDAAEEKKLAESARTLQGWLSMFELIPLRSRCQYGRLPHPRAGQENKNFLDIAIVVPVEKREEKR